MGYILPINHNQLYPQRMKTMKNKAPMQVFSAHKPVFNTGREMPNGAPLKKGRKKRGKLMVQGINEEEMTGKGKYLNTTV